MEACDGGEACRYGPGGSSSFSGGTAVRVLPWLTTVVTANLLHYRSLWEAREEAARAAQNQKKKEEEEEEEESRPLSFDLMRSPAMRRARYKIKLLRYGTTSLYLALFYCLGLLPEAGGPYVPGWGTVQATVGGLLGGLTCIYLDENRTQVLRSPWQPALDLRATMGLDILRIVGGALLDPLEEELFYHSWLYRCLCKWLMPPDDLGFSALSFKHWSWAAWLACNCFWGAVNGQEWRSFLVLGLLSNWAIATRGQFLDGVLAHSLRNLTVSCWVLATGQRHFW